MPMRDALEDWRRFDAQKIPSKAATPQLDRFLAAVQATASENRPLALLDVGCGTGRLGRRLYDRGFSVLGVDVNPHAVRVAQELAVPVEAPGRSLRFVEGDFAADHSPRISREGLSSSSSANRCSRSSATPAGGRTFRATCTRTSGPAEELTRLLEEAGFGEISVTTEKEASSRRPEEAAYFHYAACPAGFEGLGQRATRSR